MISGHHIRQGTVVAASPYSIHRNKDLYPDLDALNLDRWLDQSDQKQVRRLKGYTIHSAKAPEPVSEDTPLS
jgi:cytochrome P450